MRSFLIDISSLYQRPFNGPIDRWDFCRHHVVPLHTHDSVQFFGGPVGTTSPHGDELPGCTNRP